MAVAFVERAVPVPESVALELPPSQPERGSESRPTVYINPQLVRPDEFLGFKGTVQENILISLLETGDKTKIQELRPDFGKMDEPLSYDEQRMALWTGEIVKSPNPITVPVLQTDNPLFSQILHTVYLDYKNRQPELAAILEEERQRKIMFDGAMFTPAKNIGKFTAARRYRGILEHHVEEKKLKQAKKEGLPKLTQIIF